MRLSARCDLGRATLRLNASRTARSISPRRTSCRLIPTNSPSGWCIGPRAARHGLHGGPRCRRMAADVLCRCARQGAQPRSGVAAAALSPERPIVILSGNDLEHQWLTLAAMHVGIPVSPISPAYSLVSSDFANLRHIFTKLTPGLVFVNDGAPFTRAIDAVVPKDVEVVAVRNPPAGRLVTAFSEMLNTKATRDVDAAYGRLARTRSQSSCSPRARPASPRVSSTRSACCARTRP